MPAASSAQSWQAASAAGGDFALQPELEGHGFVLFDATRSEVAGGTLRLAFNTDTVHVGLERLPLVKKKLELSVALRGELFIAGLLTDYYVRGERVDDFGFRASYVHFLPRLQWHVKSRHTLELLLDVRRWFFGRSDTDAAFTLPPDTWVFEPRIGYVYWHIKADAKEWQAHRLFPRIRGVGLQISVGADVRSDRRPWGAPGSGPRNDPSKAILIARQSMRAGWQARPLVRFQLEQTASWGEGEDDLTRNRVGGMNPYVVAVPGLPWAALLSERLLMGQLSAHVRACEPSPHEFGLTLAGGALNDVRRQGELDEFGGAGGISAFADLRFGRWQLHSRLGWAFPVGWLEEQPHISILVTLGASIL